MITPFSNYYHVSFKETPIDYENNYFGISEKMMLDFEKVTDEDASIRYSICLKRVLFKLAPSELDYFFQYQLPQIEDKLDWLRNVNGLISNINEFDNSLYTHQNRKPLLKILSDLIKVALNDISLSKHLEEETIIKEKIQLDISVKEFAALIKILVEENFIQKPKNEMQMFRTISGITLKKNGEPLSPNGFKNQYLIKKGKHFNDLHGRLLRSAQNAHKKITP